MSDRETLKNILGQLGLADKFDEVLNKTNKFGPTTKFDENGNLIWLDMSQMEIDNLPSDIFSGLENLQELKLFKNNLSDLPDDIFDPLTNLTELHLKDNNISKITPRHFEKLDNLNRLFLLGNPLPSGMAKVYPNKMAVDSFIKVLENEA